MTDEVGIKFSLDWVTSEPIANFQIDELIKARRPLWLAGLIGHDVAANVGYGNMSVKAANKFIITGTRTGGLRSLNKRHFALVTDYSFERNTVQCVGPIAASSESLTHASLYELDWAIGAVVHVHSTELWHEWVDELPTTRKHISYGTPEMADEVRRLYENDPRFSDEGVMIMGGHQDGLISIGDSVREAVDRVINLL